MSKRYEWINGETYCDSDQMYDNETGNKTQPVYVADLLNEQDKKIKDLEAKLEDRTEQLKIALKDFNDIQKENDKLAQQLAEKEKKIEDVEDVSRRLIRTCGKTNCYGKNQTAIEELEKVKNFLLEKIEEKQSCFDSGNYNDFADGVKTICELMLISIDKQIKELGGVENVF